jgi:hypothetical protein
MSLRFAGVTKKELEDKPKKGKCEMGAGIWAFKGDSPAQVFEAGL